MRAIVFLLLAAVTVPAAAQTAEQDVRCLIVSNIFSQTEKDAAKRQVAGAARLFYLGRVDARMSGPALKTALVAQAKSVTAENAGPAMTACARSMQGKMAALQGLSATK
ncbi:hypothetical protein HJG53_05010 [Sphingomonas sp. ID1715]|uniref:hypothetical protein n=1 Tax=Sphingomonas sp. ID1715 TaxID=1656898 RepID=UPI001487B244|nr:hypothetical protein [Sphingomonas sp. ID1715]NNM76262.1 hypothetical protein [Sphingomonas sp. ID1715]